MKADMPDVKGGIKSLGAEGFQKARWCDHKSWCINRKNFLSALYLPTKLRGFASHNTVICYYITCFPAVFRCVSLFRGMWQIQIILKPTSFVLLIETSRQTCTCEMVHLGYEDQSRVTIIKGRVRVWVERVETRFGVVASDRVSKY
jgi:hypothetical protein